MINSGLNNSRIELLSLIGMDKVIVSAEKTRVKLDDGSDILDFSAQFASLPFGHNPKKLIKHLTKTLSQNEPLMGQPFITKSPHDLALKLREIAPFEYDNVVLGSTGSEIVERALKLARLRTGKKGLLSTHRGYHGKTLGALTVNGTPTYQEGFFVKSKDFRFVPFGDLGKLEAVLKKHHENIGAFIVEPIQGEAGSITPPKGYIKKAIELCNEYGVLFILDEIQTGFGRTGKFFAVEHENTELGPDILIISKSMGGGIQPIAAMLVKKEAWVDGFDVIDSSTFAAMKLPISAALKTIDLIKEKDGKLINNVAEKGNYLEKCLNKLEAKYKGIFTHTGKGLLRAIHFNTEFNKNSAFFTFIKSGQTIAALSASYLLNRHNILTAPPLGSKSTIRLTPPLIVNKTEINELIKGLDALLAVIQNEDVVELTSHILKRQQSDIFLAGTAEKMRHTFDHKNVHIVNKSRPKKGYGAFLVPATTEKDAIKADPSLANLDDKLWDEYMNWIACQEPQVSGEVTVRSKGKSATMQLIAVPMTPKNMFENRLYAKQRIIQSVDLARELGATHVGMGAHTSIFTNGGVDALNRDINITNGNTGTAISAVHASLSAYEKKHDTNTQKNLVLLGATGSVGSTVANIIVKQDVSQIYLCARHTRQMSKQVEAFRDINPNIVITMIPLDKDGIGLYERNINKKLDAAFRDANIVISALAIEKKIELDRLGSSNTVICDTGRPANFDGELNPDLYSFDGGLFQWPVDVDLRPFQVTPHNQTWGCLGETMLLVLEGIEGGHVGKDPASSDYVKLIENAAKKHEVEFPSEHWKAKSNLTGGNDCETS